MADAGSALELSLPHDAVAALRRRPQFVRRAGGGRGSTAALVWYDTPEGALAASGLALCERRIGAETVWRLERLRGGAERPWPPGTPPPLLAQAASPAELGHALPAPLLPVAAFAGRARPLPLADAAPDLRATLLLGTLRAVVGERGCCRLLLDGPAEALERLALSLAAAVPLSAPETSLAAEAYATAGRAVPPRAHGAPDLPSGLSVEAAFSHAVAHLSGVLLHWAPLAAAGATPEPVHQMRVALRRLRSVISLFRAALGGPDLDAANAELGALSQVLGPARDWDVFGAGTGAAIAAGFPGDRAVARLLAAAQKQRLAGYAALRAHLAAPAFRLLGIRLACLAALQPWQRAAATDEAAAAKQASLRAAPLAEYAGRALGRRLARVQQPGAEFADLPIEALHALRIQSKRLRYAAEVFAPLFPRKETRKFLRRIGALQERLGHLNDGAVAEALMAQLQRGGAERALAIGVVRGFVAAGMRGARAKGARSWRRFCRLEAFWE